MCAAKAGKLAKVTYVGATIAGMGTWNLSGFTRETLDDSEFTDDIKTMVFGLGDGGTVEFAGYFDPDDTAGQIALNALIVAGTVVTSTLRFYVDAASYWTVASGSSFLITKGQAVTMDKNGLGQCSFSAKISGTMVIA